MTRGPIAIVSDVHGNADAMMAVCTDMRQRGIQTVWCLGDLAGYGPNVNAVAGYALRHWTCIAGNHDSYLADCALRGVTPGNLDASADARRAIGIQLTQLGPHAKTLAEQLDTLPSWARPRPDVLLIHPEHEGLAMYPKSSIVEDAHHAASQHEQLAEIHREDARRLLVFRGHTHRPACFVRSGPGWLTLPTEGTAELGGRDAWINPGSVGESRVKGDRRAFYAVYHPAPRDTITFVRIEYETRGVRTACEQLGLTVRPAWAG